MGHITDVARHGKDLSEDRRWYVYALCDPRDDSVRYVGQTVDRDRRYAEHVSGQLPHYGGPKENHPVRKWICPRTVQYRSRVAFTVISYAEIETIRASAVYRRRHARASGRAGSEPSLDR
jgi:hypothetical protein